MKVYDAHSHLLTTGYHEFLEKHGAASEDGIYLPKWNLEDMIAFMDESGIDWTMMSVSSPQPYFADDEAGSKRICRELNEAAADAKSNYPYRIGFHAILPLPNVDAAIDEAIYSLDTLHANGIKLASNSRGQYLGAPELDPLFAELDKRHAIVNIHPHRPQPINETTFAAHAVPLFEFFCDTTRTVLDLVAAKIPSRYPNIRIIVPHCGAFLPNIADRAEGILPILVNMGFVKENIHLKENLQKLYFDTSGNPVPDLLPLLMKIAAPDHILYGSDYPFTPSAMCTQGLKRLQTFLHDTPELAPYEEQILYKNAAALFQLPS